LCSGSAEKLEETICRNASFPKNALFTAISIPEVRRVNCMYLMCPVLYFPYFLLC
jgi:preprotein translocase subunit SecB